MIGWVMKKLGYQFDVELNKWVKIPPKPPEQKH
jgi:hypothetical protein